MDANEVARPMGVAEQVRPAGARPLVFNPRGFLVAILQGPYQAELAKAAVGRAGFGDADLRVYTSQQILDDQERFTPWRSAGGHLADNLEARASYFGYAREGRSALWVRVPDDADADRAARSLAGHQVLHIRHYRHGGEHDIRIR